MAISNGGGDEEEILAEINMTPLIDIMLVLLIIFMVTSSVALESGLDINIPKTTSETSSKEGNAVMISLSREGTLAVQGVEVPSEGLQEAVAQAIKDEKSGLVILEGDKQATLKKTIRIMDAAKSAGAEKFAIAAEKN